MKTLNVDALAEAIANYLDQHPDAADSAEGIQRWWLGSEFHDVSIEKVHQALGLLKTQGIVTGTAVQGERWIFRRAQPPSRPR